jgi:hypothetical protein
MTELKTQKNNANVEDFLNGVEDEVKREDSFAIMNLMREVTGEEPAMWGPSIVGFGSYHYKYPSGRDAYWFKTGFSPRAQSLTLYIMDGFSQYDEILIRLGKYSTGKSCLYVKKLEDIDIPTLKELMERSVEHVNESNLDD